MEERVAALQAALAEGEATLATFVADAEARLAALRVTLETAKAKLEERPFLVSTVLQPLLPELICTIFALLPVDTRLRCREVSRAWCTFLEEPRLWHDVDLSASSGVARRTPALLVAACERAGSRLRVLNVSGWPELPWLELQKVVKRGQAVTQILALGTTVSALRGFGLQRPTSSSFDIRFNIMPLMAAAPALKELWCDVSCRVPQACALLANQPPFGALRMGTLQVTFPLDRDYHDFLADQVPPLHRLLASAAEHAPLQGLQLHGATLDADACDALPGLRRCRTLKLEGCVLPPAALPALTRLLSEGALQELCLSQQRAADGDGGRSFLSGAALPPFCAALRQCRLTKLELHSLGLWRSLDDAIAVLAACVGHAALRSLSVSQPATTTADRLAVGHALGALAAAESSLTALSVGGCHLYDEGLAPLFAALGRGGKLASLSCAGNYVSHEFGRSAVLPAVAAATALRSLDFGGGLFDAIPATLTQAMELVQARSAAAPTLPGKQIGLG